jgi:hypothetical protein
VWTAVPQAAGYRIVWRQASAAEWEHELHVGNLTEYVIPHLIIDDYIFGVAAVGPKRHESTVAAYLPLAPSY